MMGRLYYSDGRPADILYIDNLFLVNVEYISYGYETKSSFNCLAENENEAMGKVANYLSELGCWNIVFGDVKGVIV